MEAKKKPQSRAEWLEERRTGIGGSDAAAIIGLNDYSSPYSVWADKLGYLPEKEDSEAMRQGRDLEEYVAQRFCEATGKRVRRLNRMLRNDDHPFMLANIDRQVVGERAGLECKTTSVMNLKKFKNGEYPATYYCQCMHYLAVTGWTKWYLAVLVLNQGFYVYEIERDEAEIAALVEAERKFWALVQEGTPPKVDHSDATRRALEHVSPLDEEAAPILLYGKESLIEERTRLKVEEKRIKEHIGLIDNTLRKELDGAPRGVMHGYEVALRRIEKAPYTVNPKPYTQLLIKEVEPCQSL